MLSVEEKAFVDYWTANRHSKKKVLRQLYAGLPLAMVLIVAIFANLFSGWYARAQMVMSREASSLVIVLVLAALAIVVFIVIFSARHRWEQNELRYRELMHRAGDN